MKPVSAVVEAVSRYGPRLLERLQGVKPRTSTRPRVPLAADHPDVITATRGLRELIDLARAGGRPVVMALHPDKEELTGEYQIGHGVLDKTARDAGIEPIDLREIYKISPIKGADLYLDHIHPSVAGQQLLADVFLKAVMAKLSATKP